MDTLYYCRNCIVDVLRCTVSVGPAVVRQISASREFPQGTDLSEAVSAASDRWIS